MTDEECPHGCSTMVAPVGDILEPADPYCPECGHIAGHGCGEACDFGPEFADTDPNWPEPGLSDDQRREMFVLGAGAMAFGAASLAVVFTVSVTGGYLIAVAGWLIALLTTAVSVGVIEP